MSGLDIIFVGLLLFVLPALYPVARYFAVHQSILLEGKNSMASMAPW